MMIMMMMMMMMMIMMMVMIIKFILQKQTPQTMYLNSCLLIANNNHHLYVDSLLKLFLDYIFNFYDYVLFKKIFHIHVHFQTKLFLSFAQKNLLSLILGKQFVSDHKQRSFIISQHENRTLRNYLKKKFTKKILLKSFII